MEGNTNQSSDRKQKYMGLLKNGIVVILIISVLITNVCVVMQHTKIDKLEAEIENLQAQVEQLVKLEEAQAARVETDADDAGNDENTEVVSEDVTVSGNDPLIGQETGRKVYLTFDDGPSVHTDEILDILKEYNVKATFFVIGKDDEASRERMKRIVEEGHTIGVHSYSHDYSKMYASVEAYAEDFEKLQDLIYDATGVETKYYRFPGGSSNTTSKVDMQELVEYLDSQGVTYYDWNVDSGDGSSKYLSTNRLVENCMKDIAIWKQNAVILLHDSVGKNTTVEALPALIEAILALEDTQILPITEDAVPVQHFKAEEVIEQ